MVMPKQKPHRSKQDYQTPPELLSSLRKHLKIDEFYYDLAALDENTVASKWYTEADDALKQDWPKNTDEEERWCFCNPPYSNITPWVKKAWEESLRGASIAMLLPASVGSNWWADYVHDKCKVMFIRPRITFVGATDPYPKDCVILLYGSIYKEYILWNWKD